MKTGSLARSLTAILGAAVAWRAAVADPNDAGPAHGYAAPGPEIRFLQTVTIENSAVLDATGKPYDPPVDGPDVKYHSRLYGLLYRTYIEDGRRITFRTDAASQAKFRAAIREYPGFPFGYCALALALRAHGDPAWRDYALQAVAIFERTTALPACNEAHFAALRELRRDLAAAGP